MMPRKITLLFASETGTTEMVADEIVDSFEESAEAQFEAHRMDRVDPTIFERGGLFLVMTSSTGQGELPKNGRNFYAALDASNLDLSHVRYGLVGFGDRHYAATFGAGARILADLLTKRGARRIGDVCQHDKQSSVFPEDYVMEWLTAWLRELDATLVLNMAEP